jgi:N-acetylmuramoyl-L-alanine amidase
MKRTIKNIIIHCAATPNGKPFTAADIDAMHGKPVFKNGVMIRKHQFERASQWVRNFNPHFKYIGYQNFIGVDGKLETGRALEEVGAHVQGNNANSVGTCMAGTDKFTEEAWLALRSHIISLAGTIYGKQILSVDSALNAYQEMKIKVSGHRDYSPDLDGDGVIERNEWLKICPGFSVSDWINGGMMPMEGHLYV